MDNFFHLPPSGRIEVRDLSIQTEYRHFYQNAAHEVRCRNFKDKPITITKKNSNLEIAVGAESINFRQPVDLCTVECPALFVFQSTLWSAYSIEPLSEREFAFLIKARIRADLAQICRAVELLEAKKEWLLAEPEPPSPGIPYSF